MASNPVTELASAIQSVHIVDKPDPDHDINPSTAASRKIPANIVSQSHHSHHHTHEHVRSYSSTSLASASTSMSTSTIPSDIIAPRPRRRTLPPFPDFRFEQSYLNSIKNAENNWQVAYITFRDQLVWPLVSGIAYNLLMFGWRFWNRETKFKGAGLGARVRKWWWRVNNWKIPANDARKSQLVTDAEEFYQAKFASAQGD